MTSSQALELTKFWFGEGPLDQPAYVADKMKTWFGKAPAFDAQIKAVFAGWLGKSVNEDHLLAEILLHDQIPRNAFRDTAKMFAYDKTALELTRKAITSDLHKKLRALEVVFLLLPLEHSENLEDQDLCVSLMQELQTHAPVVLQDTIGGTLNFATRHREVIRRFGRFPHRNAVLDRPSTPEESEFLKQPGSRF